MKHQKKESPQYVRTSTAAAITMGKLSGRFLRGAQLFCINLLLTYEEGCAGNCAYCGLSESREAESWEDQSFIRVDWPLVSLDEVMSSMSQSRCAHVERVCLSMITNGRAINDTIMIVERLKETTDRISVLITPSIVNRNWLSELKEAGVDMVGVAIDAATPELFDKLRGRGVNGPHKWDRYWNTVKDAIWEFGEYNVGVHLVAGLGETEEEMIEAIQKAKSMTAHTHLFSFFPEKGSLMEAYPQPPIGQYRRIQLANYLINKKYTTIDSMEFDSFGRVTKFGVWDEIIENVVQDGSPFITTGCPGDKKECACNRPFGNSTPSQALMGEMRNFPFELNPIDVDIVRKQLWNYATKVE